MTSLNLIGCLGVGVLLCSGCSDDGAGATADGSSTGQNNASTSMGPQGTSGDSTGAQEGSGEGTSADSTGTAGGSSSGGLPTSGSSTAGTDTDTDSGSDSGTAGPTSTGSGEGSSESTSGLGDSAIGDDCNADNECMTGVCWDFEDYDPFCFGAVCSVQCEEDQDCIDAFDAAGAPNPKGVSCGFDGRCDPIGSGFGAFACAGG